jgi:hypothetical protein
MLRSDVAFNVLSVLDFAFGSYGIPGLSIEIRKVILGSLLVPSLICFLVATVGSGVSDRRF